MCPNFSEDNLISIANRYIPNKNTCPDLCLNGQEISDEMKYFGILIATNEVLEQTTINFALKKSCFKVKHFYIIEDSSDNKHKNSYDATTLTTFQHLIPYTKNNRQIQPRKMHTQ